MRHTSGGVAVRFRYTSCTAAREMRRVVLRRGFVTRVVTPFNDNGSNLMRRRWETGLIIGRPGANGEVVNNLFNVTLHYTWISSNLMSLTSVSIANGWDPKARVEIILFTPLLFVLSVDLSFFQLGYTHLGYLAPCFASLVPFLLSSSTFHLLSWSLFRLFPSFTVIPLCCFSLSIISLSWSL